MPMMGPQLYNNQFQSVYNGAQQPLPQQQPDSASLLYPQPHPEAEKKKGGGAGDLLKYTMLTVAQSLPSLLQPDNRPQASLAPVATGGAKHAQFDMNLAGPGQYQSVLARLLMGG